MTFIQGEGERQCVFFTLPFTCLESFVVQEGPCKSDGAIIFTLFSLEDFDDFSCICFRRKWSYPTSGTSRHLCPIAADQIRGVQWFRNISTVANCEVSTTGAKQTTIRVMAFWETTSHYLYAVLCLSVFFFSVPSTVSTQPPPFLMSELWKYGIHATGIQGFF